MSGMFLPESELEIDLSDPRPLGSHSSGVHIGCSDKKKVTATRTKLGYVVYCHKCQRGGFIPLARSFGAPKEPPAGTWRCAVSLAKDVIGSPPLQLGRDWLDGYNVSLSPSTEGVKVGSLNTDSLSFAWQSPIDGHWTVQTRIFGHSVNKWITKRDAGTVKHPALLPYTSVAPRWGAILVEDIVSAMKLRQHPAAYPFDIVSLNGLTLSWDSAAWLYDRYKHIVFSPDVDPAGYEHGEAIVRGILRPLFGANLYYQPIGHPSPKNLSHTGLEDYLIRWARDFGLVT